MMVRYGKYRDVERSLSLSEQQQSDTSNDIKPLATFRLQVRLF